MRTLGALFSSTLLRGKVTEKPCLCSGWKGVASCLGPICIFEQQCEGAHPLSPLASAASGQHGFWELSDWRRGRGVLETPAAGGALAASPFLAEQIPSFLAPGPIAPSTAASVGLSLEPHCGPTSSDPTASLAAHTGANIRVLGPGEEHRNREGGKRRGRKARVDPLSQCSLSPRNNFIERKSRQETVTGFKGCCEIDFPAKYLEQSSGDSLKQQFVYTKSHKGNDLAAGLALLGAVGRLLLCRMGPSQGFTRALTSASEAPS